MQLEPNNKGRNCSAKEESKRYTRKTIKRQYTNEQYNERNSSTTDTKRTSKLETDERRTKAKDIQNQTKNRNNNILNRISYLSHFVSNPQIKNRPRRKIKGYTTLSKQAIKEYMIKKANASGIAWDEEYEM